MSRIDRLGLDDYANTYSRGNDDQAEQDQYGEYETGVITVTLTVDISACVCARTGCEGDATVKVKYVANVHLQPGYGGEGGLYGFGPDGPRFSGTRSGSDQVLSGEKNLGSVPCKGGSLAGSINIQTADREDRPGLVVQTLSYSASVENCGRDTGGVGLATVPVEGKLNKPLRLISSTYLYGPFVPPYPPFPGPRR